MPQEAELTIEELAARLDQMERRNRALRFAVVIALLVAGAALVLGHFVRLHTATAERFAVLDAKGDPVAVLGAGGNGLPALALSNAGMKPRAVIGLKDDGSVYLALSDAGGKLRWAGFVNENGLHVEDGAGKNGLLGK